MPELGNKIQHIICNFLHKGFTFPTYMKCPNSSYQVILALMAKTDYGAYNQGMSDCYFVDDITEPLFAQSNLSLIAIYDKNTGGFDATVEYVNT